MENNLNNCKLNTTKAILQYTVLFAIMTAGIFVVLALLNKSLMEFNDGYKQGYFLTNELKQQLTSLFSGHGFPLWSWSKGLGMPTDLPADPLAVIAALFPARFTELGFSIATALRLYFGGLAFLIFGREMRMTDFQCLCGALLYTYSTWFINTALIQNSFLVGAYMMPLLVLSIDHIYGGRSPLLFICAVAYYLMRDAYAAYMAAIVVIIYILLRYFAYSNKFTFLDYIKKIGSFIGYGLVGILVSSVYLLQTVISITGASTENAKAGTDLLYNSQFYIDLGKNLISTGMTSGYTFLGLPILILLVLPIAFSKISLKNTSALMTLILLIMMLFPFFSSMFNGFNYSSGRWYFTIMFFATWSATEVLDIESLQKKKNVTLMLVSLAILTIWTIGFQVIGLIGLSLRSLAFILMNLAAATTLIFSINIYRQKSALHLRRIAVICISGITLIGCWSLNFYLNQNYLIENGHVAQQLSKSTQRVSASINDEDFYRTDQVDWINVHKDIAMPANENLWWQAKSIYQYDSMLSSRQLEFNKLLGNNYGYYMRVFTISNDNRMGLDFLEGVKYFLGNDLTNGTYGSDEYAGYGFSLKDNIDGVNVFKNKYDVSLGFGYDRYMYEKEFLKLSIPEREQALLQTVIVPDNVKINGNIKKLYANDIDTDVTDVPYEFVETDTPGTFKLHVDNVNNSQLLVSFENLQSSVHSSFSVKCSNERISEVARSAKTNQSIPGITDYTLNMGYYENYSGDMIINLPADGNYRYDKLHVYAMSADNYDKYATKRLDSKYEIDSYDNSQVNGEIEMNSAGILYLSIPQYSNWDIYVDGNKCEKLENVNVAFVGVELSKGHHVVQLRYHNPYLLIGLLLSLLGMAIMICIHIIHKHRTCRTCPDNRYHI